MSAGNSKTANRKIISDSKNNKFLDAIIRTLNKPAANGRTADASDIFQELMDLYIRTSQDTYLRIFPAHFFKHVEEAKQCLAFYTSQKHKSEALSCALEYLNKQQLSHSQKKIDINIDGSFGLLLSTFFAMFPEKLADCNDELRQKIKKLDLWSHAIGNWVNHFMAVHRAGGGGHDHEILEYISAAVPDELADKFAHFLLSQLHDMERHEAVKGLYRGWIYAALSRLLPKLSHTNQHNITNILWQTFKSHHHDLSLIGLCQALSCANISDAQLKEVADHLYNFTLDELKTLAKLHEDHQSATTALYMEKLFHALKKLDKNYNAERRNGLMQPLLESSSYLYNFRRSILILEDWIPVTSKLKVMERLQVHESFVELAPLFWHWLLNDKNHNTPWAISSQYSKHIMQARLDLMDIFNNESTIASQVKLVIADNSTRPDMRGDIIENLTTELTDLNKDGVASTVRKELHLALMNIKPWAEAKHRILISKLLLLSCKKENGDPEDVRVSAARAAAEYSELFTSGEATLFKNNLLPLLEGAHADKAAAALQVFAMKRPPNDLPEFLTCLLTKNNIHSQLLLASLYHNYIAQDKPVERKIRLAV